MSFLQKLFPHIVVSPELKIFTSLYDERCVDYQNILCLTPMTYAATETRLLPVLTNLLPKVNINAPTSFGYTPLMAASQYINLPAVKLLLSNGARVNPQTIKEGPGFYVGDTALSLAIRHATDEISVEIIQLLLDAGADPNKPYSLLIELSDNIFLAENMFTYVMKLLIRYGAFINDVDYNKDTPLLKLLSRRYFTYEQVLILLNHKADVNVLNKQKSTPLTKSISKPNIVHLLLTFGALPNQRSRSNNTALILSAYKNMFFTAKILLAGGADPNLRNNLDMSALDVLVVNKRILNYATLINIPFVKILLSKGAILKR